MGGHGGLNILPQKRWNVYNFDNREKVRQDEEAAAREEQLKREQSRRQDAEFRLERLRQSRGLPSSSLPSSSSPTTPPAPAPAPPPASPSPPSPDSRHINLFDGLQGFSSLVGGSAPDDGTGTGTGSKKHRTQEAEDGRSRNAKKHRKEEPPRTVTAEDEKYKLGYGLVGKGVKAPWYMSKAPSLIPDEGDDGHRRSSAIANGPGTKNGSGKKTIEELREERMKREKQEKERARALLGSTAKKGADRGFSRRRY